MYGHAGSHKTARIRAKILVACGASSIEAVELLEQAAAAGPPHPPAPPRWNDPHGQAAVISELEVFQLLGCSDLRQAVERVRGLVDGDLHSAFDEVSPACLGFPDGAMPAPSPPRPPCPPPPIPSVFGGGYSLLVLPHIQPASSPSLYPPLQVYRRAGSADAPWMRARILVACGVASIRAADVLLHAAAVGAPPPLAPPRWSLQGCVVPVVTSEEAVLQLLGCTKEQAVGHMRGLTGNDLRSAFDKVSKAPACQSGRARPHSPPPLLPPRTAWQEKLSMAAGFTPNPTIQRRKLHPPLQVYGHGSNTNAHWMRAKLLQRCGFKNDEIIQLPLVLQPRRKRKSSNAAPTPSPPLASAAQAVRCLPPPHLCPSPAPPLLLPPPPAAWGLGLPPFTPAPVLLPPPPAAWGLGLPPFTPAPVLPPPPPASLGARS